MFIRSRLPAELTDRVIDHLHSDKDALAMCSLVCKAWLPASRFHFFPTKLRLTNCNIHSFVELLNSPVSTFFGHALNVEISPFLPYLSEPLRASCIFDAISHHLFRLKIKSLGFIRVRWDIKDEKLEGLFGSFATISILQLEDVRFSVPDQFIRFIASFVSLERVKLCGITTLETVDVAHITPFTLSPLLRAVDLTLQNQNSPFTWFLSAVPFPPLDYLGIFKIASEDLGAIQAVLQSLGPSLHHLNLGFDDQGAFILGRWCAYNSIS
jgi:hypothetical protein